ncbi:rhamnose ABC transporter substrate-binding protein [Anaerocolumna sp. AGMB13025]|uniref:rhamnose ABC transporter substrate-binding protein n=1 Tax=Anaerocolumna sp. AGMB13025 TaxID=3039116 RepID=UPI00241FBF93|nr:rhamnose ABC transporter substrate-binding protein [Anaerocolumna sp. AGMB13025]WFR55176.1 rhamnose ABC transporter substrate-binding protein [Anaerocolumna sp. AGMB13025]
MKKMKKVLSLVLVFSMVLALFTACGKKAPDAQTPAQGGSTGTTDSAGADSMAGKNFAILVKSAGNPYNEKESSGFKEVIEAAGATAILKAPEAATAEAQITMINELIAQKVSAIAIAGNDFDALQPALKKAMDQGIKVLSLDAAVNKDSRMVHINQADSEKIGRTLIQATKEMVKGEGQIAILSATSQAANQNTWIEWMKKELEEGDYKGIELVKIAYGDDEFQKSVDETEALLKNYPDLKAIIAPTTVGIAAASKVVTDKGLIGKVAVTGLGLPSEMAEYIANGSCPWMYLWNPIDVGSLAAYASMALVKGDITGAAGDKFDAGSLGSYEVISAADGGTEVLLGAPFKFDKDNIDEWKTVY